MANKNRLFKNKKGNLELIKRSKLIGTQLKNKSLNLFLSNYKIALTTLKLQKNHCGNVYKIVTWKSKKKTWH